MKQSSSHLGRISSLLPTVNFANRMTTFSGQEWGPRTIPDCQLLYVIDGKARLELGPKVYDLSTGDCIFYGSESPHYLVASETRPMEFASIHFSFKEDSLKPIHPEYGIRNCGIDGMNQTAKKYSVEIMGYPEVTFPHYFTLPAVESLFLQIVREYRLEEPGYTSILRGLLTQIITIILRQQINGQHSGSARKKILPALEAIRKEVSINWKAEELAALCGYHPTYFAQLFREATGQSPKHYLILERIRKAKSLLVEGGTMAEIAEQVGYTSHHYFCRNFKEITGLTPTEFKRRNAEL